MSHLQPIPSFTLPSPLPPSLARAFSEVPLHWAGTVSTSLPGHLQPWIDYDTDDRQAVYKMPIETDKKQGWKATYKEAQSFVLLSLPNAFRHELELLFNVRLGYGPPFDLYDFITKVDELCRVLDVSFKHPCAFADVSVYILEPSLPLLVTFRDLVYHWLAPLLQL